jgi:hypothetical protein
MSKKRTSLDSLFTKAPPPAASSPKKLPAAPEAPTAAPGKRPGVKQQTVYMPNDVHEQLRRLAFEERAKMHDYLMEGLDLVFAKRGLPSISELQGQSEGRGTKQK